MTGFSTITTELNLSLTRPRTHLWPDARYIHRKKTSNIVSKTNNKRAISTFKFGYPCLTLKEEPKVKSDHLKRFAAHDFLWVGFTLRTSRTNNERAISIFKFGYPHLTLKEGPKVKSDHLKRFAAHDFL